MEAPHKLAAVAVVAALVAEHRVVLAGVVVTVVGYTANLINRDWTEESNIVSLSN